MYLRGVPPKMGWDDSDTLRERTLPDDSVGQMLDETIV